MDDFADGACWFGIRMADLVNGRRYREEEHRRRKCRESIRAGYNCGKQFFRR